MLLSSPPNTVVPAGGKGPSAGGGESLFSATYRKGVLMGCLLFVFQQFSGINAIVYFSSSVFKQVRRERGAHVQAQVQVHLDEQHTHQPAGRARHPRRGGLDGGTAGGRLSIWPASNWEALCQRVCATCAVCRCRLASPLALLPVLLWVPPTWRAH